MCHVTFTEIPQGKGLRMEIHASTSSYFATPCRTAELEEQIETYISLGAQVESTTKRRGKGKRSKVQPANGKRRMKFRAVDRSARMESLPQAVSENADYTPLQLQFIELKRKHPDVVLLMETGYLYRFFGKDAEVAEKELDLRTHFRHNMITTSVPYQTLHIYIGRLTAKGYKVGVVRKTESALTKASGEDRHCIFKRDLVALYTISTLVGEEIDPLSSNYDNNYLMKSQLNPSTYLMCVYEVPINRTNSEVRIGMVAVCPLSGDIIYDCFIDDDQRKTLQSLLSHVKPVEMLIPQTCLSDETERVITAAAQGDVLGEDARIEKMVDENFKYDKSKLALQEFYDVAKPSIGDNADENLMPFVLDFPPPVVCCMGAILAYLKDFQLETLLMLVKNMKKFSPSHDCLYLDSNTVQALRLFPAPGSSTHEGSLFWLIDKTTTLFGSRLLRTWLSHPLTNVLRIEQRLNAVSEIKERSPFATSSMQVLLSKMPDLESGITSIFYKKCSTKKYWKTITSLMHVKRFIEEGREHIKAQLESQYLQKLFLSTADLLDGVTTLRDNLDREAAWHGYKNRLFKQYTEFPNLCTITNDISETRKLLDALLPGIATHLGRKTIQYSQFAEKEYVIIAKPSCASMIPSDWIIVAQTNQKICCRTPEMDSLAKKLRLLQEHFKYECHLAWLAYLEKFKPFYQRFRNAIINLAKLDCLIALATLAKAENYVKPTLSRNSEAFLNIIDGRHPVMDHLMESDKQYIPNSTLLMPKRSSCMIISGANMGGKSTYVRGAALVAILSQIGSFVPAKNVLMTPLKAIYARSGVRDNILRGKSSFCVEAGKVSEMFQYLPPATLVLLDEFGRCTSDTDGIGLAYGLLKYLVTQTRCLSLVVTKFPEITKLGEELIQVKNYHMSTLAENSNGGEAYHPLEITYLYKLEAGVCERGYSQKVCRMAGIEESVLKAAEEKSNELEEGNVKSRIAVILFQKVFNGSEHDLLDGIRQVKSQPFL